MSPVFILMETFFHISDRLAMCYGLTLTNVTRVNSHKRFPHYRTDGFPSAGFAVLSHRNIHLVYIFEKLSQDKDYDLEQLMPWTEAVADTCGSAASE